MIHSSHQKTALKGDFNGTKLQASADGAADGEVRRQGPPLQGSCSAGIDVQAPHLNRVTKPETRSVQKICSVNIITIFQDMVSLLLDHFDQSSYDHHSPCLLTSRLIGLQKRTRGSGG